VDVHEKLDELSSLVEEARSMPMSASCIVNRAELLGLLEELRELLPEEFRHAQLLLDDREAVVEEGRREAQKVIAEAEVQRDLLTSETAVVAAAEIRAEEIRLAAVEEAQTMRAEVDDYVDSKLANFEVVLDKTMAAVHRGRDKLRGRTDHDHFAGPHDDDFSHPLDDDRPLG
jgi:cell division septum initiation protein DivIVA